MAKSYNLGKVVGPQGFSPEVELSKEGGILKITVTNETSSQTESITTGENVQANWDTTDTADGSYIWNKPEIPIVTDTYSATSSDAMSGKAVADALSTVSSNYYQTDEPAPVNKGATWLA